jgi:hypothetical protein
MCEEPIDQGPLEGQWIKGNLPDSEGGTGSMRVLRSRPSEVNPHLFGAAPAMYAHALSSVSLRKTCNPNIKLSIVGHPPPNHAQNLQEWDLKHDALSAAAGTAVHDDKPLGTK